MVGYWLVLLLQSSLVFVLPLLVGRWLFHRFVHESWLDWPLFYVLGAGVLFALALVYRYILHISLAPIWFISVGLLSIIGLRDWFKTSTTRPRFSWIVALLIATSLFSYGVWAFHSQLPLNWDWFQHQTMARIIQQGDFSFLTSNLSDTFGFNSYPPFFHLLISMAQYPFQLSPTYVMDSWIAMTGWYVVVLSLLGYGFGYSLSQRQTVGILTGLMSVLVFDSTISITTYSMLPQSFAAIMTIGVLMWLFGMSILEIKRSWWLIVLACLSIVLMHYMVGLLGAGVIIFVFGYRWLESRNKQFLWLIPIVVGAAVALFLFKPASWFIDLNKGEASMFVLTLQQLKEALERGYGYFVYLFIPMGIFHSLLRKTRFSKVVVFIFVGLCLVLLSGLPYVLKTMTITRFFIFYFIAWGVCSLIDYMSSLVMKIASYASVIAGVIVVLLVNIIYWKGSLQFNGVYTHISPDEVSAAQYIQSTFFDTASVQLISDPATQFVLEGLSGIDSPGGAYMDRDKRIQLVEALISTSSAHLDRAILVQDRLHPMFVHHLVALSGRTYEWLRTKESDRYSFGFNMWSPVAIAPMDAPHWQDKIVFYSRSLVIYQID